MKQIIIAILLFVSTGKILGGGERTNLQGIGMARTSTAVARGIDAIGINPANLGYPDKGTVTFNIINFGTHIGTDFFDIGLYKKYFTGNDTGGAVYLTDGDKLKILETFPSSVAHTNFDFELKLFSLSFQIPKVGGFALSVIERAGFNLKIPKDYVELILYGNPLGRHHDFSKTYFNVLWLREYALSYGRRTPRFVFTKSMTAGFTVKLIHGFGTADVFHNDSYFRTDENAALSYRVDVRAKAAGTDMFAEDTAKQNYSPFPRPAGTGVGFDLGVSGFVIDELSFGIALVDLGSINWTNNTREVTAYSTHTIDDPFAGNQLDTLENAVKTKNRKISGFSTTLPTALRLGVAYQFNKSPLAGANFPGELLFAFDYHQGFNNVAGNTTAPRFSLGVEYKPWKWLPIRTGLSVGGTDRLNMGLGFGLMFGGFNVEFASENFGAVFTPNDFKRLSLSFGMRVRI